VSAQVPTRVRPSRSKLNAALPFEEAKAAAIEKISSEIPDNGLNSAWILAKEGAARRMTEDSLAVILATTRPTKAMDEIYAAAQVIQKYMTDGWVE
jgi:hypothetical protein